MIYKSSMILDESVREIVRNKYSLLFSSLILTVLATIYFTSLSYSINIFNAQKSFYANNPVYAILSSDVKNSDVKFITSLAIQKFKTENIVMINNGVFDKSFWKELGVSKSELIGFGFKIPKVLKITYDNRVSTNEINQAIKNFKKKSGIVKSFVYNDEGFKNTVKLWSKTRSYALFYIFSSVFSLVFFIFILLCFLGLNKKENLRVLDYLGASDQFVLIPIFLYTFVSFFISGVLGTIISLQLRNAFNISLSSAENFLLFASYLSIFALCYIFFPFFINRILREENA